MRVHDLRDISWSIRVEHYNVKYLRQVHRRDGDKSSRFFWLLEDPLETLLFLLSMEFGSLGPAMILIHDRTREFLLSYKLKFHYVGGWKSVRNYARYHGIEALLFWSASRKISPLLITRMRIDRILLNDK